MANLVKILSTELDSLSRRVGKFLRYGKSDVQTSTEVGPYGVDSNPIKGMVAVYAETGEKGKTVIVGYLNKNQLAEAGEFRIYSTNANGVVQAYAWLKNDGTILLGGESHNLVRFTPLDTGLQNLKTAINTELTKIQTAITGLGGAYTKVNVSVNIDDAKINEIKTL